MKLTMKGDLIIDSGNEISSWGDENYRQIVSWWCGWEPCQVSEAGEMYH